MGDEAVAISARSLNTVALHSVLAGLCPLIPLPFIDDMIVASIHRRMVGQLADNEGVALTGFSRKLLSESNQGSLLKAALKGAVAYGVKKLVRKLVYVLSLKSCADVATAVFLEGWLFARALEAGYVDKTMLRHQNPYDLRRIRGALLAASSRIDPSATRWLFTSLFEATSVSLDRAVGELTSLWRSRGPGDEGIDVERAASQPGVEPLIDALKTSVTEHWQHGPLLDEALAQAFAELS